MRIRSFLVWLYPVLLLAVGAGFLIWSFSQAGAADAYRNAPACAAGFDTSGCYQQFDGQISSVQVSQTRDGERDDVVIQTVAQGPLTATLEPSATAAPHVRTGAQVKVKLYSGQVMLVEVDGILVASTANPVANQGDATFTGWFFVAFGVLSLAVPLYPRWRRKASAADSMASGRVGSEHLESEILPSGNLGWSVRPRRGLLSLWRFGLMAVLLLAITFPAIVDPARSKWATGLDSVVLLGIVVLVGLFLRNDRVFADGDTVGKTDLLGRTVRLPKHDVARADRFSVANRYGRNRHLVFVRADGRKAFEVAGPNWDYHRLDRLCRSAGIKLTGSYDELVGAFKLNQRVPGTTRWGQQLALGLGLIVLIVAFVVLLDSPGRR
jgi:hypothetical protein